MPRRNLKTALLAVALAMAVVLVLALAGQVRSLRERYVELRRIAYDAYAGMYVPPYTATTLSGDTITLGGPGQRQLLFFLTTTCPYCQATLATWKALADEAASGAGRPAPEEDVRVIGVVLDSTHLVEAYRDEHGLAFPLVVLQDLRYAALFRVTRVPLTMVVDGRAGRVVHARIGELEEPGAIDSIRAALRAPARAEPERPPAPVSTRTASGAEQ